MKTTQEKIDAVGHILKAAIEEVFESEEPLFVCTFTLNGEDPNGMVHYCSNAVRKDIIPVHRRTLNHLEGALN